MKDKDKKEEPKRGNFADDFAKAFERGMKKTGTAHRNELAKNKKYDLDVVMSGQGGFTEPEDDGIKL